MGFGNKQNAGVFIKKMRTASLVLTPELTISESPHARPPPRGCTFSESDWRALAPFWYPVALSHEVNLWPYAVTLLDERVVVYRLSDGSLSVARDICHHRGAPLASVRSKGARSSANTTAYVTTGIGNAPASLPSGRSSLSCRPKFHRL